MYFLDPLAILIVLVLALFQSIFGVGVLFLGTPILLAMGIEYAEALVLLLPISIIISMTNASKHSEHVEISMTIMYLLIPMTIAMYFALELNNNTISLLVSGALVLSGVVSLVSKDTGSKSCNKQKNSKAINYFSIGLLHGVSNMGGGLLIWYHNRIGLSKEKKRALVAFLYGIMAVVQLSVLIAKKGFLNYSLDHLYVALAAVLIFFGAEKLFTKIKPDRYSSLLNIILIGMGLIMVLKTLSGG